MQLKTMVLGPDAVKERAEYANFNRGPHLCVDVPDGPLTITCRTSEGRKITFAFCPYQEGGPAQCVDVQAHDTNAVQWNGDFACPLQTVICFGVGRDRFRSKYEDEHPTTLTTVILKPAETHIEIGKKRK